VLVLSEIWNYNLEFYQNVFHGYTFHYVALEGTNVGGVGVYVKDVFDCTVLDDLHIASDKSSVKVENLWLKITNGVNSYVIGAVYRHPNSCVSDFCKLFEPTLNIFICNSPMQVVTTIKT